MYSFRFNSCTHAKVTVTELSLAKQHVAKDCAHAQLMTLDGKIEITSLRSNPAETGV